ncbi:MAG: hypothetical protein VKM98_00835 [Cyanobacteriota bacterium]|nr:hypothetical protein [Cyanobacteriota bacterium]
MPRYPTPPLELPSWFPLRWQLTNPAPTVLMGHSPLPWWCGAWYQGELRRQLLGARQGNLALLDDASWPALVSALAAACQAGTDRPRVLVPIPANPGSRNTMPAQLAGALAATLGYPLRAELLQRSRRRRPQRGLGCEQRWRNQWHSFRALVNTHPKQESPAVLLVDDVLTSGATALAAQRALQEAGWHVSGVLCLARTPLPRQSRAGRDLRSLGQRKVAPAPATTCRDSSVGRAGD